MPIALRNGRRRRYEVVTLRCQCTTIVACVFFGYYDHEKVGYEGEDSSAKEIK